MRMVYSPYDIRIELAENIVNVLSVENPQVFSRMIEDLWLQLEGGHGEWILSDNEKILTISKSMVGVFNPFSIDCNERKILGKVYSEIAEEASQTWARENAELNGIILNCLDGLLRLVPYQLESKYDFDIIGLLKLYDVKINTDAVSLLERIIDYIKVQKQICHIDVMVFVNIKQYLTDEEIMYLYETARYMKVNLFLLERFYQKGIPTEKNLIFDNDLCIIEIDELTT